MASDVGALFSWILELFMYEVEIYGVRFSMFQVFIFSAVAGIAGWFLGGLFFHVVLLFRHCSALRSGLKQCLVS